MLSREDNDCLTQTGPGTPMGTLMRRFWVPFMLADEIAERDAPPLRVRLLGEDLLAFRDSDGRLGLVEEFCPHRRVSLYFGRNEACGLRCVYHGWKFDVEGNCVDLPSEPPASTFKDKIKLAAYPVRENAGLVWAYLGPKELQPGLPQMEWMELPDDYRYVSRWYQQSNYAQAVEGEIDSSHVSFLHSKLDNDAPNKAALTGAFFAEDTAPRWKITESPVGMTLGARRNVERGQPAEGENQAGSGGQAEGNRPPDGGRYYWRMNQWLYPFYTMIAPVPGEWRTVRAWVPADDHTCNVICITYRNDKPVTKRDLQIWRTGQAAHAALIPGTHTMAANAGNDYNIDRALQRASSFTGIVGVRAQDAAMTEGAGPIIDRTREHLATSDTAIIKMRRLLIDAARALENDGVEPAAAADGALYRVRSHSVMIDDDVDFDERADVLAGMVVEAAGD
jgi:phenylpropionate dioxygenase-like ring-hydroxylating dioxygenase large terminal subunit